MSRVRAPHYPSVFVFLLVFALLLLPAPAAAQSTALSLPAATVAPGQDVVVAMTYTHGSTPIVSLEMRVTWNTSIASLVSVAKGSALGTGDGWMLVENAGTPGQVDIVLATGDSDLTASGQLLLLTFHGVAKGTTPLTIASASLNEGAVSATLTAGSLRVNTAPVAADDSYTASEDTLLTVPAATGVKANDSDADGDTPLNVTLLSGVAHGTLNLATDGSFTYQPAANYNGPDSFTYTLTDPYGLSDTASVAITVNAVNDPPVASAGGPYSVAEGGSVALAGSVTDVDHTTGFTYEWDLDNNGSFETTGATPTFSAVGYDGPSVRTVALRVRDAANGLSAVVNATVNVSNVAPTANPGGPYSVPAGGTVVLNGSGTDPGNDTLSFAWDLDNNGSFETAGATPTFSAAGLGDSTVTIKLQVTDDDGAPSSVVQTTVTIGTWPRYSFSGAVLYWKEANPVVGVAVNLTGASTAATTSAAGGAWSFSNLLGYNSSYTVKPSYAADSPAITAYDAALVLKHVVGLGTPLAGHAFTAADVNSSGGLNTTDASLILRKAVGLISVPFVAGGPVWKFDPAQRDYASPTANQTGQNFTAILLGDPSGSWAVLNAAAAAMPGHVARIELSALDAAGNFTVIVRMGSGGPFHAAEMTLLYDAAQVVPVDIATGVPGVMVARNDSTPGTLQLAAASATAVAAGADLLRITLHSNDGAAHAPQIVRVQVDEQPAWAMQFVNIFMPLIQH